MKRIMIVLLSGFLLFGISTISYSSVVYDNGIAHDSYGHDTFRTSFIAHDFTLDDDYTINSLTFNALCDDNPEVISNVNVSFYIDNGGIGPMLYEGDFNISTAVITDTEMGPWDLNAVDYTVTLPDWYFPSAVDYWMVLKVDAIDSLHWRETAEAKNQPSYMSSDRIVFTDYSREHEFRLGANPVPEPATMLLFGIGLLGLAGVTRRKQ